MIHHQFHRQVPSLHLVNTCFAALVPLGTPWDPKEKGSQWDSAVHLLGSFGASDAIASTWDSAPSRSPFRETASFVAGNGDQW